MSEIKVMVMTQNDRKNLYAKWIDPVSGKSIYKTTRQTNRRKAQKFADQLEFKLNKGMVSTEAGITWEDFRKRYREEHLSGLAKKTEYKAENVLDGFGDVIKVKKLKAINEAKINLYISQSREKGRTEATIKGNLAYIKASLNWTHEMGLLDRVSTIKSPKRARRSKLMKGRPITGEEFDRILLAIPDEIDKEHQSDWNFFLKGLWWSGLRLGEAINLTWKTGPFCVVEMEDHYYFTINSDAEKETKIDCYQRLQSSKNYYANHQRTKARYSIL